MEITFNRVKSNALQPVKEGHTHFITATSKEDIPMHENDVVRYGTGISINIPTGHVGLIYPLVGIYKKKQIFSNSIIVVFEGDEKEIVIDMTKGLNTEEEYKIGNKIAQIIIVPVLNFNLKERE